MVNSVWIVVKYIPKESFNVKGVFTNTTKDHVKKLVIKHFGEYPYNDRYNAFDMGDGSYIVLSKHDVNKFG